MVWSRMVVAWNRCNIIMPAHKVLCKGYLSDEGVSLSDWLNLPSGPPKFISLNNFLMPFKRLTANTNRRDSKHESPWNCSH